MASSFKASGLSGLMGHELDLTDAVPQSQPLNKRQVSNNAGGYTFQVDDMARLRRFLIIGSEGGTYYVNEQKLTLEAARGVKALLDAGKGVEVVAEITRVSTEGRAPKQGPGVFALALCCRLGDADTKSAAFDALPKVCRTASTLFDFVNYCKAINQEVAESEGRKVGNASWGRAMRHAVASWYLSKRPLQLAYQVTKYGQRGGWSNRDLLRLAHPQPGFIRVQAQRQETAQAAGELEKVSLASPRDEEADWEVVDGVASVLSEDAAPSPQAAAAVLDQRVNEMQQVFRFIVDDEAPPAAEGDSRVAAYLAAAHRLRKAQALLPPEKMTDEVVAQTAAAQPANAAAQLAAEPWPELSAAAAGAAGREAAEGAPASGEQPKAEAGSRDTYAVKACAAADQQEEATAKQQEAAGPAPMQIAQAAQPQQAAATDADVATATDATAGGQETAAPAADGGQAAAGKQEEADSATVAAADAQPASKKRRVEKAKAPVEPISVEEACELIRRHRFGREHIGDTRLLKSLDVWGALLDVGMPFTALTRNLGRLTSLGAFDEVRCSRAAEHLAAVTKRFQDPEAMKAARAHPIVLLNALRVYAAGRGDIGSLTWQPHKDVVAALDAGFYHAFRNVQPTGKRFLLGVDVSGSMEQSCTGMTGLTARDAAAAVAMCLLRTEGQERVTSMAFTTQFSPLDLRVDDSLETAVGKARSNAFGGTDCAQPMVYALQKGLKVDCFVVLTDSETWFGGIHPTEALRQYRAKTGIPARLLVLAFSGSYCTIADPEDAGMLDVPGLDAGVPEVMRQFVLGEL